MAARPAGPGPSRPAAVPLFLALALALVTASCGERGDPHGTWDEAGRTLVLRGTAAEMGRAHGVLLRGRVRTLHARWRDDLFRAALGVGVDEGGAAAKALAEHLEDMVDAAAFRLPERLRQELDALAEAAGLEPLALLELEVMRDALRMRGLAPRLPGGLRVERGAMADLRIEGHWTGPDGVRLAREAIWIRREPSDGRPATLVLCWPGALGGLLAVAAAPQVAGRQAAGNHAAGKPAAGTRLAGTLVAAVEVEVPAPWKGFGHGLPFSVAVRVAVEDGADLRTVAGALKGTVGHVAVTADLGPDADPLAVASTEAYLTPDKVVQVLDATSAPRLLVGPHADLAGAAQQDLDAVRSGPGAAARAALARHLAAHLPEGAGTATALVATWERTPAGAVLLTLGAAPPRGR